MAELLSEEAKRGYICAVADLLHNGDPQQMYDLSESDPNQTDFDIGWRKACLEYGAKCPL